MDHKVFKIEFSGLPEGSHEYKIKVMDSFLEDHPLEDVYGVNAEVVVLLEKKSTFLNLHFTINGELTLNCDICTESYKELINYSEMIVVKYGDPTESDPEDVLFISPNDTFVDVRHFIYEFISISTPLKRIHKEIKDCNQENINFIHNFAHADQTGEQEDPRWAALKNIKF